MFDVLNTLKNPAVFQNFFKNEIIDRLENIKIPNPLITTPTTDVKCEDVNYEYDCAYKSTKQTGMGFLDKIEDKINRETLMSGSTINWDKKRLIEGKLAKLHEIGGAPVLLETPSHSKISSQYFSVESFFKKIQEMGGRTVELQFRLDHPFFAIAKPAIINISSQDGKIVDPLNVVRIPYDSSLEAAFYNPTDFLDFCHRMRFTPIWEDTLEPVNPNIGWNWSSRQQNMLIVPNHSHKELEKVKNENSQNIQISENSKFDEFTSIFSGEGLNGNVIAFNKDADIGKIMSLFDDLKINKTPMDIVEMDGQIFIYKKSDKLLSDIMYLTDEKYLNSNPLFHYEMHSLPKQDFTGSGAVILSMNQTNSFTQYTHEILTFLLEGVNVLAYDNAGKGLSVGNNSESGLKEAVETCGEYLIQQMGFAEDKVLFKGQCAGGLPSSEAAKTFPQSHIWIDQSSRNFSGVATNIYNGVIKNKIEENKDDALKQRAFSFLNDVSNFINPIVSIASKLILPKFDVIDNLSLNNGSQIYTIGVPDIDGHGGDSLVPDLHKEEIMKYMSTNQKGHYLPMPGATHVTDWWLDPATYEVAQNVLAQTGLSKEIFLPKQTATDQELVDAKYQSLTGTPFDHKNFDYNLSTNMDAVRYSLLHNTAKGNIDKASLDIEYMEEYLATKDLHSTFKACLDIAKQKMDKAMILLFLEKVRASQ